MKKHTAGRLVVTLATVMGLLLAPVAQAASLYWDSNGDTAGAGDTPTGTWGSSAFWNATAAGDVTTPTAVITTAGDDLFFSAGTDAVNPYTISLNSATQNGRLVTFEDGTVTLSTGTLSLGNKGGITVSSSTVSGATISSGLTLSGSQTFNVAASRTLALDTGTFTRNAGSTLNVLSTGTITSTMTGLDSASMVNGIIGPWASFGSGASTKYATIDGGNNIVGLTGTAAATAANVTSVAGTFNYDVAAAGTLGAGANINTLRYTGAAGTIAGGLTTRGIMNVGGGALVFSGTVTGSGELVVNTANGNIQFNAANAAGSYGLIKDGPGRLTTANSDTTFSGTVTVNGGVLQYGDSLARLTSGNITLNGGVMEQRWNAGITTTQGSGTGQIRILGGESGFSQNGATGYTVNIGAITWGSATFNPSKFVLQTAVSQNGSSVTMASASTFNLGGATRTILVNSGAVSNASATIAGAISNGGLIKEGAGLLVLNAANNYAGGTTISAGTLRFDTRSSMPASGTVTVADGATLGVTVAGSGTTWGSGTGVAGIAGLTSTANSGEGYGGQTGALVNFNGNSFLNLNVTSPVTELSAIGDGSATSIGIIKTGASSLTLGGTHTYSGGTTLIAGTLAVGATAVPSTGTIRLNGGTIQSSDANARTFSNALTIGGDFTVGGTGSLTFSNTGASALGATRTITVTTSGVNATFAQAFSGSTFGITKAGAGTLTLTGANTFTGTTTINAGTIVLNNDGDVTGSAVTFGASNTGLAVTGGSGVTSIWNAGGGNIATGNGAYSNIQMLINGAGTAGSARVTNVGTLIWGRTATGSTLSLTNGGQMNVNGEIRIGNPYYSEAGGANVTIGGGTATSTFSGDGGDDFYIGYGERTGSKDNVVTVSANGLLTNIRDMYVGHINNGQNNDNPTTNNKLLVPGGTASMRGLSLGYIQTDTKDATANVVAVTGGGQLSTSGTCYIGRANNATSTSNTNMVTIAGTGSSWNAGAQTIYVGHTANATATSKDNILTVSSNGVLSNVSSLIVGFGTGTETGNKVVLNGGSITATTVTVNAGNSLEIGADGGSLSGNITYNGSAFIISSTVPVSLAGNISGSGGITQSGSGTTTLSGSSNYSGGTTINAGMVHFTRLAAMPASGAVTVTGATLGINVGGAGEWTTGTSGNGTVGGLLAGLGGQSGGTVSYSGNVTLALDTTNAVSDQTYAGVIGNVGTTLGLTKLGTGTLILNQENTYTGTTIINAGTLALGENDVFADTMPLSIGNATLDAATFTDTADTLDVTGTATINLGAGAALAFADSNAIDWTGGTLALTGTLVPGVSLRFGTTSGGLTSTQLALISLSGWRNFSLDSNGYLTAVEAVPPTVLNVTSAKPDGTYNRGEVIDVTVQFSEPVYVTGTPRLTLETGETDRNADYISGSETDTLSFRYTVQLGDLSPDLDYTATGALTLNGGTIRDAAENDATLTLPAPGAAGSLGANKALVIFAGTNPSVFRFR